VHFALKYALRLTSGQNARNDWSEENT